MTFCVEFGQTSRKDGEVESTPIPFWVESYGNGRWGTLMIGPDMGRGEFPVMLEPGKSQEFGFRLNGTGTMRLRLLYWRGAFPDLDCQKPPKGAKRVTSSTFVLE